MSAEEDNADLERIARLSTEMFHKVAFHQNLGLEIEVLNPLEAKVAFDFRPSLAGFVESRLHGGVAAGAIDAVGGALAIQAVAKLLRDAGVAPEARFAKTSKLCTVSMQLNYLRPLAGNAFLVIANVLRTGAQIVCVECKVANATGDTLVTAVATYLY